MQCPSCGFQNLPELALCARCLSRLTFDGVDVNPYRASDRGALVRSIRYRLRPPPLPPLVARMLPPPVTLLGTPVVPRPRGVIHPGRAVASVLPGLGQWLGGRRWAALLVCGAYLVLLLAAILLMDSPAGAVLVSLAILLHAFAMLSSALERFDAFSRPALATTGLLLIIVLKWGLYPAVGYATSGVGRLEGLTADSPAAGLVRGDVVLVQGRWLASAQYRPGDLVSYRLRARGADLSIPEGTYLDYVLAGPGDQVVAKNGRLLVNGKPLSGNLNRYVNLKLPDGVGRAVPPETYFIYPLSGTAGGHASVADRKNPILLEVSMVPRQQIRGRALRVLSPPSRWGRL